MIRVAQVFYPDAGGDIAEMVDVDDLALPARWGGLWLGERQPYWIMDRCPQSV